MDRSIWPGALWSLFVTGCCAFGSSEPEPPRVFDTVSVDEATRYPGVPPPRIEPAEVTSEQLERRARSIARLRAEGVPVLDELPVIETESACRFRTRDEILDRALALLVVASRGAGDPEPYVDELAARFDTTSRYSPAEAAFMTATAASAEDRAAMSWRFESLLVLAWALGYIENLPSPASPTDGVVVAEQFRTRNVEELRSAARLRSGAELLDLADLAYRYHWATVDAWVGRRPPPAGVSPDVIMEWHHAINWLIGYQGAAWDDVSTDT